MKLSDIIKLDPISVTKDFVDGPVQLGEIFNDEDLNYTIDDDDVRKIMADCELRTFADGNPNKENIGTLILAAVFYHGDPVVILSTGGSWGNTEAEVIDNHIYWTLIGELKAASKPSYYNKLWDPDEEVEYVFNRRVQVVDNKLELYGPWVRTPTK